MTPFTFYVAMWRNEKTLIEPESLATYVRVMGHNPGLRILRIQDDVPPRDVTEDVLAGVVA